MTPELNYSQFIHKPNLSTCASKTETFLYLIIMLTVYVKILCRKDIGTKWTKWSGFGLRSCLEALFPKYIVSINYFHTFLTFQQGSRSMMVFV